MFRMSVAGGLAVVLGAACFASGQIVPISRLSEAVAGYTGGFGNPPGIQRLETTGFEDVEWSFQLGGTVSQTSRITGNSVHFDGLGFGFPGGGGGQRYGRSSMVLEFSVAQATRFRLTGEVFVNACPCHPGPKAWARLIDLSTNLPLAEAALTPAPGEAMLRTLPFDEDRPMPAGLYRLEFHAEGANYTGTTNATLTVGVPCYANCDGSTTAPVLNVSDFTCFLNSYAAGDPYANCDGSTIAPVLNVSDFTCFLTKYAVGCP